MDALFELLMLVLGGWGEGGITPYDGGVFPPPPKPR